MNPFRRIVIGSLMSILAATCAVSASDRQSQTPHVPTPLTCGYQSLVIGYSDFDSQMLADLPLVEIDIKRIGNILHRSSQYDVTAYVPEHGLTKYQYNPDVDKDFDVVPRVPVGSYADESERLKANIDAYLKRLLPTTKLLFVYLSSHGKVDAQGKFHLAVTCTKQDDGKIVGSLEYNWLFDRLGSCPFPVLLVIDSCDSGGANIPNVLQAHQQRQVSDNKLMVMVSSHRNQRSTFFGGQSRYSYWLCKGLLGFADIDSPKGVISACELHNYCLQHMVNTGNQCPMRFILGANQNPEVVPVSPVTLDELLQNTAELYRIELLELQKKNDERINLRVANFVPSLKARGRPGTYAAIGKVVALRLHSQLVTLFAGDSNINVLPMGHASSDGRSYVLTGEIEPVDLERTVLGEPLARSSLKFLLYKEGTRFESASSGLTFDLNADEVAAISGETMPAVVITPENPSLDPTVQPIDIAIARPSSPVVPRNRTGNCVPPSILDNAICTPQIWIKNKGSQSGVMDQRYYDDFWNNHTQRKMEYRDGRLQVNLTNSEEFVVLLRLKKTPALAADRSVNKPYVYARVLVDGRSTLPYGLRYEKDKDTPASLKRVIVGEEKQQMFLADAQPWFIDGFKKESTKKTVVIPGFVQIRRDAKAVKTCFPFVMTSEDAIGLGGKKIEDFEGTIMIALYEPVHKDTVTQGTIQPGQARPIEIRTVRTEYIPGKLIGTYVICYQ